MSNKTRLTYSLLLAHLVEVALDIVGDGAGALVDKCILRLVVEKTGETDTLLLSAGQDVLPLLARVPAAFAVREVSKLGLVEDALQVRFVPALAAHVELAVGVDDLVAERADGQIRPLREEHDAVLARVLRPADKTAVDGPEPGQDA